MTFQTTNPAVRVVKQVAASVGFVIGGLAACLIAAAVIGGAIMFVVITVVVTLRLMGVL